MSSENGWNPARLAPGADELEWITVPGSDNVSLQLMKGAPLLIMRAYAADYNQYVERLRDADSAAYTPTNAVATSNHLNATAMDLNWDSHPFRVADAGYTPQMIATMNELLEFYEDTMFWANNWDDPKDAMHHQMGYDTWNSPATGDFIARKIRVDGYSTFRRGDLPYPTPGLTQADQYAMTIIDVGRARGVSDRGQQIAIATALVETNLKNYANSNVPESMNIPHDAVGSDHDSVGLFQQRCPMWGPAQVLMDPPQSAGLFYDQLVKLDYNNPSNSPGSYAQAVQRSAFPDRYDQRFGDAVEIFNRVTAGAPAAPAPTPVPPPVPVPAPPPGGAVPLSEAEQRELLDRVRQIWGALFNQVVSKSRYADPNMLWQAHDFWRNDDGFLYDLITEHDAALGDPAAIARVQKAAAAGDRIARQFLAQAQAPATSTPTSAPVPLDQFGVPVVYTAPPPPAPAPVIYTAPPPPPPPAPATYTVTPQVPPMSFHDAVDAFAAQLQQIKTAMAKLIGGPPE